LAIKIFINSFAQQNQFVRLELIIWHIFYKLGINKISCFNYSIEGLDRFQAQLNNQLKILNTNKHFYQLN